MGCACSNYFVYQTVCHLQGVEANSRGRPIDLHRGQIESDTPQRVLYPNKQQRGCFIFKFQAIVF